MKKSFLRSNLYLVPILFVSICIFCRCENETNNTSKPRLIVTTDIGGDPDDQQSMIRLMLYANELDIEGIIATASGTPGELDTQVVKPELITKIVNAYDEVQQNLSLHDKGYPSPDEILSKIKNGNPFRGWENVGHAKDTEGSEWIIQTIDGSDFTTNITIWGGQTDLAQALYKVKNTREKNQYDKFISKIRIYDIGDQDGIYDSIIANHPNLFYILNKSPEGKDKRDAVFRGMYLGGDMELTSLEWLQENVLENHGLLGSLYPTKTWTAPNPHGSMKEGDTPSWFYFLNNGLNIPEKPQYGGWGGRFKNLNNIYTDAEDCIDSICTARATLWRWRTHFQNDFQARMDWCVLPHEEANHAPLIEVNGDKSKNPLKYTRNKGLNIILDASKSFDPDENELSFNWYLYEDISGKNPVVISNPKSAKTEIISKEKGVAHIILEVSDNGEPSLVSYRRIIVEIL